MVNFCILSAEQNKQISSRSPGEYVKELKVQLGHNFESVLLSNLIPPEAIGSLLNNDYEAFLDIRSQHIHKILATCL